MNYKAEDHDQNDPHPASIMNHYEGPARSALLHAHNMTRPKNPEELAALRSALQNLFRDVEAGKYQRVTLPDVTTAAQAEMPVETPPLSMREYRLSISQMKKLPLERVMTLPRYDRGWANREELEDCRYTRGEIETILWG